MINLTKAIDKKGIGRKELASKVGITYQQLHRYEKQESEATESKIIALCTVLNVSADYLLGIENKQ